MKKPSKSILIIINFFVIDYNFIKIIKNEPANSVERYHE